MPDVLLVVDVQPVFKEVIPNFEGLLRRIELSARAFKELGFSIVGTEQYPEKFGETPEPLRGLFDHVIRKMTFNAFLEPSFLEVLGEISPEALYISGIETHICVYQTSVSALEKGYRTYLLRDLTASFRGLEENVAVEDLRIRGVRITTSESVIYERVADPRRDVFKRVLPLVKEMRKVGQ